LAPALVTPISQFGNLSRRRLRAGARRVGISPSKAASAEASANKDRQLLLGECFQLRSCPESLVGRAPPWWVVRQPALHVLRIKCCCELLNPSAGRTASPEEPPLFLRHLSREDFGKPSGGGVRRKPPKSDLLPEPRRSRLIWSDRWPRPSAWRLIGNDAARAASVADHPDR
jgi:hypothetical protein